MQRLAVIWLLLVSVKSASAQELCGEDDDSTLLQLGSISGAGPGRVSLTDATDATNVTSVTTESQPGYVGAATIELGYDQMPVPHASLIERVLMKANTWTYHHGLLLISLILLTVLSWGEIRNAAWLQGTTAACLASFSLVAANTIAKALLERPDSGIGVLDLIYAQCIVFSFLGVAFTRFHPDKPIVIPQDAYEGVRTLSVGFFSSAGSMLLLGGLAIGPPTAVLLTVALQSSLTTVWKQFLRETIEPEEYLSAPLLLFSILVGVILGSVSAEGDAIAGRWMWACCFGFLVAICRATCSLQQRTSCSQMHHVVMLTYAGAIGLIMFGPIAAAYPQHARAMWSLDMTNFAPLVLFGVLSLSFTLGLLKAANSVWGTMSESCYTLVAGLSLCLQFLADLTFFPVAWAPYTHSSIALAATCMFFSYAVSYKQVVRAEQCFSTVYSLFEPQNFRG